MPSLDHEALVLLFRNRPELAPELINSVLDAPLPPYQLARVEAADFTSVVPTEYRADVVVLLVDDRPLLSIIVEVQLQPDPQKRKSWPVYVTHAAARFDCQAALLVIAGNEKTARFCAQPIEVGAHGSLVLKPWVIGPKSVPVVTSVEQARRSPELAVLSAIAHGEEPDVGLSVGTAALQGIEALFTLDEDRFKLYSDLVLNGLGDAAKAALEKLVMEGRYEYQSELVKGWIAEGKAVGKAEGKTESILAILSARNLTISEAAREKLLACTDLRQLDQWLTQALTVASTDLLFPSSHS